MQIFVRTPTGSTLTLDVEGRDTVESLRAKISDKHPSDDDAHPALQRLVMDGVALEDGKLLQDYGMKKEAQLVVGLRQKEQVILIIVGGGRYRTTLSTLLAVPDSKLHDMFVGLATHGTAPSFPPASSPAGGGAMPEGVPRGRAADLMQKT